MYSAYPSRPPPHLAWIQQACFQCYTIEAPELPFQRCSGCRRISFCSAQCQRDNWKKHKAFCRAWHALETPPRPPVDDPALAQAIASGDFAAMSSSMEDRANERAEHLSALLGRPLDATERNLVDWEPRCMVCQRSEQDIRMEIALNNPDPNPDSSPVLRLLTPCERCHLTFFCSQAHHTLAAPVHATHPAEGPGSTPPCRTLRTIFHDLALVERLHGENAAPYRWVPERVLPAWRPLHGSSWHAEYGGDLRTEFAPLGSAGAPLDVEPLVRAGSEGLSMALTALWALENLWDDDDWTLKRTLVIHIIGSSEEDLGKSSVFEELMHRVPAVKELQLVMIGPELVSIVKSPDKGHNVVTECCAECQKRGRRRGQILYGQTYHDFAAARGARYAPPDLAIAFNAAIHDDPHGWAPTIAFLIRERIPSLFTSQTQAEATSDAALLRALGAPLHPSLGPARNSWGSQRARMKARDTMGFYGQNRWLSGGFKA